MIDYDRTLPSEPPTPRKRHHLVRWILAILGAIVILSIVGSVLAKPGASHSPAAPVVPGDAATVPSGPPPLSATQQSYVADMRTQFGFDGTVANSDIVDYGQSVCTGRSGGGSQADAQSQAKSAWSNVSGTDAYKMTRLAETDLCPAWLPAVRWHTVLTFSGSGTQNSDSFRLHAGNTKLRVTYSYSANSDGFGGGDNFIADLVSSTDDLTIANDIAVSGGKTTLLYPDTSFGGSRYYHLEVQATGGFTFTIQQRY